MNFSEAAHEILSWAGTNRVAAAAVLAGTLAVGHQLMRLAKPYFTRRAPTGFDDPEIKRLRAERGRMNKKLGLPAPREP
jgi:hypothetical protein